MEKARLSADIVACEQGNLGGKPEECQRLIKMTNTAQEGLDFLKLAMRTLSPEGKRLVHTRNG